MLETYNEPARSRKPNTMRQLIQREFRDAFCSSRTPYFRALIETGEAVVEEESAYPGGHLMRYRLNSQAMTGRQEIIVLTPDFSVITSSFEALMPSETSYAGAGWLVLQVCVAGEYDIAVNERDPQRLHPGDCRLDVLWDRCRLGRRQITSTRYRSVALYLRLSELRSLLNMGEPSGGLLDALLQDGGDHRDSASYTFAAPQSLIASVNEIAEFGHYGGLRPAYIKAKAIEFLVHGVNSVRWRDLEANTLRKRARIARGTRVAQQVKAILEREFAVQHTLDDLAHRVGSNRTTLSRAFKTEYSETPMQYRKRIRLENAREMLRHHEGTVGEVAEHVGYADAACFIRAYRHYYGMTPGHLEN